MRMWLKAGSSGAIVAVLGAFAAISAAETTVLEAARDNTLVESATGARSNGAGPAVFVGRTGQPSESRRRALLYFDVAQAIPNGMLVTRAELVLSLSPSNDVVSVLRLHRALQDWGEGASAAGGGSGAPAAPGDATWIHTFHPDSLWSTPGGEFVEIPSAATEVGSAGSYAWGSTPGLVADVQAWLDTPASNAGWILIGDEAAPSTAKRFLSRESIDPALRPLLFVEYAEPCEAGGLQGSMQGLCNAYCEALDCDAAAPKGSSHACQRLARRFARHSEGAPLPCERPVGVDDGGMVPLDE